MSPRTAAKVSASQRTQLRAMDLASPEVAARSINDALRDFQERLEAVERSKFFDVTTTTDSNGNLSPISLPAPPWPVRGVVLARAWDATNAAPAAYARIGWQQDGNVLTVALWVGDVSPSTAYDLTFEVRG